MSAGGTVRRLRDAASALSRLRELRRHDRWDRARLQAFQQERLTALVRHAVARSPFYRELYAGVDPDGPIELAKLPIVAKAEVMARFDEVVTDPRLRLPDLERHLAGLSGDLLYLDRYRVVATAGSTGRKGVFVSDRDEWRTYLAALLRTNEYLGLVPRLPRRRVATVAAGRAVHVTNRMSRSLDVGAHRVLRLDATEPVEALVSRLNGFGPEFLYSYPSVLGLLATEQLAGRLRIAPTTLVSSGETHTDEIAGAVRAAWDVPWFQIYGTTEVPLLGAHCTEHTGLHLFEDLAIVEVVDEHDQPVPAGQPGRRMLVTNLVAHTQPLIRYAITDLVTAAVRPCPCGRPYTVLTGVDGRSDDILRLPSGDGDRISVHPLALRSAMAAVPGLMQYRIVHEDTRLTVLATTRALGSPAETDLATAVTERLHASLGALGVRGLRIDVRVVPRIEDGRDSAGKLRIVESRS
jgi:phenylacetate-CoA ligase